MELQRSKAVLSLWVLAALPLFGGTGKPEDGFLSFLLLFGFLLLLLGILHGIECIKKLISELRKDIF